MIRGIPVPLAKNRCKQKSLHAPAFHSTLKLTNGALSPAVPKRRFGGGAIFFLARRSCCPRVVTCCSSRRGLLPMAVVKPSLPGFFPN